MSLHSAVRLVVTLGTCLAASNAPAQPAPPVDPPGTPVLRLDVHGAGAAGWRVQGTTADVETGAMVLRGRPGWIGSRQPLADFVLTFEARLDHPTARAGVVVRAWPTFDRGTGAVTNAYRVVLAAGEAAGQVIHHRFENGEAVAAGPPAPPVATLAGAWHTYHVECRGSTLSVSVDGRPVATVVDAQNPQGFIGFVAERGLAEVRNVSIAPTTSVVQGPQVDAASLGAPGVAPPQLLHAAKPRYTAAAMRALIQGHVLVSGVVELDGRVHDPGCACRSTRRSGSTPKHWPRSHSGGSSPARATAVPCAWP